MMPWDNDKEIANKIVESISYCFDGKPHDKQWLKEDIRRAIRTERERIKELSWWKRLFNQF